MSTSVQVATLLTAELQEHGPVKRMKSGAR